MRWGFACVVLCAVVVGFASAGNDFPIQAVQSEGEGDAHASHTHTAQATLSREPFPTGNVFQATDEWQDVQEGQAIPPGLHVEINLETGKKRARKLQEPQGIKTLSEKREEKMDRLKDFLLNLDDGGNFTQEVSHHQPPSAILNMTKEEREEILEQLFTKDDIKQMKKLIGQLNGTDEEVYLALDGLEYYVHQVDNANDLDKINGLTPVLEILSNEARNMTLRIQAAALLGTLTQNNPTTQALVLSRGALPVLVHLAQQGSRTSTVMRRRLLFALSSVLRRRLDAQRAFVEMGGEEILEAVLRSPASGGTERQLKVRAVTLLYDLLVDEASDLYAKKENRRFESTGEIKEMQLLAPFAAETTLGKKGLSVELCEGVSALLAEDDGNTAEKTMETMILVAAICDTTFKGPQTQQRLKNWQSRWLADLESERKGDKDPEMISFYQDLVHVAEVTLSWTQAARR